MSPQYVVAFHGDASLIVEAVGPFRTREKADAVCERLEISIDSHALNFDGAVSRLPHVVVLMSADAAEARYEDSEEAPHE